MCSFTEVFGCCEDKAVAWNGTSDYMEIFIIGKIRCRSIERHKCGVVLFHWRNSSISGTNIMRGGQRLRGRRVLNVSTTNIYRTKILIYYFIIMKYFD